MCSGQPQIKHRSSRYNRAPAAPCSCACSLAETRLGAPSRRFPRGCSGQRAELPSRRCGSRSRVGPKHFRCPRQRSSTVSVRPTHLPDTAAEGHGPSSGFSMPLSAVPTANLSRPRSFRSVLNPVPPSQTSPWATSTVRPSRDRCRQSHTPNFSTLSSPACGQSGKPRCSFSCLIAWSRIACTRETASTNCHDLLAWRGQASRDARTVTLVRAQLQHQGRPQR